MSKTIFVSFLLVILLFIMIIIFDFQQDQEIEELRYDIKILKIESIIKTLEEPLTQELGCEE